MTKFTILTAQIFVQVEPGYRGEMQGKSGATVFDGAALSFLNFKKKTPFGTHKMPLTSIAALHQIPIAALTLLLTKIS